MALNRSFVGRRAASTAPFDVTRGDIKRFALAMGDSHPVYLDPAVAQSLGHPDVVAPPTFLISMGNSAGGSLLSDPDLGLDFSRVVHGEQGFELHRPVCAGDVLASEIRIDQIRDAGHNELLTLITEVTSAGERVATVTNTLVSRGTAAGQS